MTSISTEPIFPLNPSYICQIWPSLCTISWPKPSSCHWLTAWKSSISSHKGNAVCSAVYRGNLEDDFPHYSLHSYRMHSLDFITKSPNPHTAMLNLSAATAMTPAQWWSSCTGGVQKSAASFFSAQLAFCLPHTYVTCRKANNSWSQIYIC